MKKTFNRKKYTQCVIKNKNKKNWQIYPKKEYNKTQYKNKFKNLKLKKKKVFLNVLYCLLYSEF